MSLTAPMALVIKQSGTNGYGSDQGTHKVKVCVLNEPRHEKTCLRGFQPGKTQTGLLSYRDQLES